MLNREGPLFAQLADQIEDDVLRGVYEEETQVPSTNEFAAFLRINPATAGKALNRLVDAGVLYKRRGIGMFVAPGARALIAEARQREFAQRFITPLLTEAQSLGLTRADLIAMIEQAPGPQVEHTQIDDRPTPASPTAEETAL